MKSEQRNKGSSDCVSEGDDTDDVKIVKGEKEGRMDTRGDWGPAKIRHVSATSSSLSPTMLVLGARCLLNWSSPTLSSLP